MQRARLMGLPIALASIVLGSALAPAQSRTDEPSNQELAAAVRELRGEIHELREAVSELRAESQRYREESERLRAQFEAAHPAPAAPATAGTPEAAGESSSLEQHVAALQEEEALLKERLGQQYQTKVESASKYRVRLYGIVLLNAFNKQGRVDSIDVGWKCGRHHPAIRNRPGSLWSRSGGRADAG